MLGPAAVSWRDALLVFAFLARSRNSAAIGIRSNAAESTDSAEFKQIYEADQKDREAPVGGVDWKVDSPRDAARLKRVRELIHQDRLRTGKDYERAAMVFQHGDTPEDILFAHVLAVTA